MKLIHRITNKPGSDIVITHGILFMK